MSEQGAVSLCVIGAFVGYLVIGGFCSAVYQAIKSPYNLQPLVFLFWPFATISGLAWYLGKLLGRSLLRYLPPVLALLASTAHAAPPVKCHNNVVQQQVFAVPTVAQTVQVLHTAVPNAIYGYNAAAQQYQNQSTSSIDGAEQLELLRQILATLQSQGGAVRTAAVDPLKLTHQNCGKCHSTENAKGGFRVDIEMSDADYRRAIKAITSNNPAQRMPRGRNLTPQVLGDLIGELANAPSTNDGPPPRPEPEAVRTE